VKRVPSARAATATTWESILDRDATAPTRARRQLAGRLAGELSLDQQSDLLLLASELVANSMVHADPAGVTEIRVALVIGRAAVRVAVTDPGSSTRPCLQPRDPLRAGGRGLFLVESLSDSWGSERNETGQTRVWFEMLRRPPSPAATSDLPATVV